MAKGRVAHTQSAWRSSRKMVQIARLATQCNYLYKKKKVLNFRIYLILFNNRSERQILASSLSLYFPAFSLLNVKILKAHVRVETFVFCLVENGWSIDRMLECWCNQSTCMDEKKFGILIHLRSTSVGRLNILLFISIEVVVKLIS